MPWIIGGFVVGIVAIHLLGRRLERRAWRDMLVSADLAEWKVRRDGEAFFWIHTRNEICERYKHQYPEAFARIAEEE